MVRLNQAIRGFSLVEVIVVSALITLVFGALLSGTRYSLEIIAQSRAKLSALSLANDRMELFRSLPYDDVGTVAGIPAGVIPQSSTTTLNGIDFTERVLVEYVDDPADGQLTATTTDNNGIPSDYKRIKIELTWEVYDQPGELALVSNIVPRSIETTAGGGTVRINVIDQDSQPLENASVQLRNDTTTSTVDVTRFSAANGVALFSGAPAASSYEVTVTAAGYSTDQTYVATTSNPNPITAPFTVLESDISTLTFQIDELSDILTRVYSSVSFGSDDNDFSATSSVASSTDVEIESDGLELAGTSGAYTAAGEAYLAAVTPSTLEAWEAATLEVATPTGANFSVRFYTESGGFYSLIPDGDLPGNSSGFTNLTIDLSSLDSSTYPSIVPRLTLTGDTNVTPRVEEFRTFYRTSETAASGVSIDIEGTKVIGTAADSSPIYKFSSNETTDGSGEINLPDMEFDNYRFTVPAGFDVAYSCPALPLNHRGGETSTIEIELTANTTNSLQVRVQDGTGTPIPGAEVQLESTAASYSNTEEVNPCGVAFFSGLTAESDYVITVTKPGYDNSTIDPFDVSDDSSVLFILTES